MRIKSGSSDRVGIAQKCRNNDLSLALHTWVVGHGIRLWTTDVDAGDEGSKEIKDTARRRYLRFKVTRGRVSLSVHARSRRKRSSSFGRRTVRRRLRRRLWTAAAREFEDFDPVVEWKLAGEVDLVEISLPGSRKDQVRVQVENHGVLRATGDRPARGGRWARFKKDLRLPDNCDADAVRARFEGEKLIITLMTASPGTPGPPRWPPAAYSGPSPPKPSPPLPPPPRRPPGYSESTPPLAPPRAPAYSSGRRPPPQLPSPPPPPSPPPRTYFQPPRRPPSPPRAPTETPPPPPRTYFEPPRRPPSPPHAPIELPSPPPPRRPPSPPPAPPSPPTKYDRPRPPPPLDARHRRHPNPLALLFIQTRHRRRRVRRHRLHDQLRRSPPFTIRQKPPPQSRSRRRRRRHMGRRLPFPGQ
ncbi:uncharacterized protein [Setaria viridis]